MPLQNHSALFIESQYFIKTFIKKVIQSKAFQENENDSIPGN